MKLVELAKLNEIYGFGFYLDLFFVFIFTKNYFFLPITAFLGKLGFGYYDIVVLKVSKNAPS
jgi:hypothetical protein